MLISYACKSVLISILCQSERDRRREEDKERRRERERGGEEIISFVILTECIDSFWEVTLRNMGYKGYMKIRTNKKQDGCAVFFKQDK